MIFLIPHDVRKNLYTPTLYCRKYRCCSTIPTFAPSIHSRMYTNQPNSNPQHNQNSHRHLVSHWSLSLESRTVVVCHLTPYCYMVILSTLSTRGFHG